MIFVLTVIEWSQRCCVSADLCLIPSPNPYIDLPICPIPPSIHPVLVCVIRSVYESFLVRLNFFFRFPSICHPSIHRCRVKGRCYHWAEKVRILSRSPIFSLGASVNLKFISNLAEVSVQLVSTQQMIFHPIFPCFKFFSQSKSSASVWTWSGSCVFLWMNAFVEFCAEKIMLIFLFGDHSLWCH